MTNWKVLCVLLLILYVIGSLVTIKNQNEYNNDLENIVEDLRGQLKMCAEPKYEQLGTKATGSFHGDYFSVWVKERTYAQVMETCNHEWMHYKYKTEWGHFTE